MGGARENPPGALASASVPSLAAEMSIARVEPLTNSRSLRGPFDYRLPARLGDVGVGTVLLVPFGRRRVLGVVVEVAESSELAPERLVEPIRALEAGAPPELVGLGLWVGREYCSTPSRGLDLVLPPGTGPAGRELRARTELRISATAAGAGALEGGARLGSRQRAALEALTATDGELSASALSTAAGVDRATLRRLEERALVALREVEVSRRPHVVQVGARTGAVRLEPAQVAAAGEIVAALERGGGSFLLHGVTGSGKTEVYLAAAAAALERGRAAVVMVPEIALTPQTASRFEARFGDAVALLHSGLRPGERRDEWERLRRGEARICVGPRSAAFAPIAGLGLIVIDEEHDPSYKQEGDPRYDAREVAARRAAEAGAVLVAGSGTPRPESWLALERLELPSRVDGRSAPAVEVLDMREVGGEGGPLHPRAMRALGDLADRGGKAIVMLNRRGWAPQLSCRSCGRAWDCPQCDVSLVVHRHEGRLRCHHCGHAEPVPEACTACGSVAIGRHGAGTERVERLLAGLAERFPVFRLDSDTAGAGSHARILSDFERAPAGVLVGTQMVAKGHDFPDVVLGVVLDADATLRFPDFRSEERTFALIAQLAGRVGRGERAGEVLVQTLAPGADPIRLAAAGDAPGFLAGELERRAALSYPPFSHLIRIELAAAGDERAQGAARRLAATLGETLPGDAQLLGPAPRFRLRGRHRRQLLVKSAERPAAVAAVREAVEWMARERALRDVSLSVDVAPQ